MRRSMGCSESSAFKRSAIDSDHAGTICKALSGSGPLARALWTVTRTDGGWQDPTPLGTPFIGVSCVFFVRSRFGNADVFWTDASFLDAIREETIEQ